MPPSIEEDEDDLRDTLIREELIDNYSLSILENESFHFDIPSFSRPPAKPPDGNTGILNVKMMGDVSDQKIPIPELTITLVSSQEKSPDLLSHRGFENFQPSAECPIRIHRKNIPTLDVPLIQKKQEEKRIEEEQAANAQYWKIPACCDDDDNYNSVIIPNEPVDSLSMGDKHLNTIPATKSDEFIKSCVENLVPNPCESEGENGCDLPVCFTTFSNFDEEIIPIKIDQHHHNAESDLIESMLNHDSSIISSSSKIDSLLDEFAGELTLLKSIPPGIDKTNCHPENEIRLIKRLLYDNSSPHPPEEFVSDNSYADNESFSPSPIPVEDSDSFMVEIDLSFNPDNPMPPGIMEDDDDSGRDILIHEEFLDNYSLSLPVIESFYFDIPSFSRPPAKPLDGNIGILNIKIMGDNSKKKVPILRLMITRVSNQEKSPDLLSHWSLEIFQPSAKCPMMIHGKNIPILDVPLFHFYPLDQFKYGGIWVKLSDLKQALRGRHLMLISSLVFLFSS
nr:hypothetical protein [Tanacetum cinerariifolium]